MKADGLRHYLTRRVPILATRATFTRPVGEAINGMEAKMITSIMTRYI